MAADPPRDRMEPPGVATGRVSLALVAVFLTLATAFAASGLFYLSRVHGSITPHERAFPAPELETNVAPRRVEDRDHGPKPLRAQPVPQRAGERAPPSPDLAAAMAAEAARGPAGYDPLPAATR